MTTWKVTTAAAALVLIAGTSTAFAQRAPDHHDWHGGGGHAEAWHGGGHPGAWSHGGGWGGGRGWHGGGFGFGFVAPVVPDPYVYSYGYAPAPMDPSGSWYFCPTSNAYYPTVTSCAVPWQQGPG